VSVLRFSEGVMLVGGGDIDPAAIELARRHTAHVVAADGGANGLRAMGLHAEAVIGDMDSIEDPSGWEAAGTRVLALAEQETTDLEKCLYSTEAPLYLGIGFTGRRFDHTLAALHALLRWPAKRIVLLGAEDAIFLTPREWRVALPPDTRVSFFPLAPVRGLQSTGLVWPIDGLDFAPGLRIGTSNRATGGLVTTRFDASAMAAMVPREHIASVLAGL
jgi:thiamine pyrophosphokinase